MSVSVECKLRPQGTKPKALRREGFIPANLYGHKGAESVSLSLPTKEAQLLLREALVNNTLVDVNIPDLPWKGKALIREVQKHPWKPILLHLSFFSVATQDKLQLVVPLNIVGTAIGTKSGGILEQNVTELNIECAPDNIPETIDIDVSNFDINTNLSIKELVVPDKVTVLDDHETTILSIVPPATAEVSESEAEAMAETEIISESEPEAAPEAPAESEG